MAKIVMVIVELLGWHFFSMMATKAMVIVEFLGWYSLSKRTTRATVIEEWLEWYFFFQKGNKRDGDSGAVVMVANEMLAIGIQMMLFPFLLSIWSMLFLFLFL